MPFTEQSKVQTTTTLERSLVTGTMLSSIPTRRRARASCLTRRLQRMLLNRSSPKISRKRTSREGTLYDAGVLLMRRLWAHLTEAIKRDDMHGATAAKSAVEDKQREKAKQREAAGKGIPEPRFFRNVAGDRWMPKLDLER